MTQAEPSKPTYLGDGLYANFDGYQFWLIANNIDTGQRVALDPQVFREFLAYAGRKLGVDIAVTDKEIKP